MAKIVQFLLAATLITVSAAAAEAATCQRPPVPAVQPGQLPDQTEPDDAFGFVDGTAFSERCDLDTQTEITGRFGKRDGAYRGVNSKIEASFLAAPRWQVSVALWHAYHSIRDNTVPGYPNQDRSAFDGLAFQVDYQFRERGEGTFDPGFAVGVEYRWGRFSEGAGISAERVAVTLKSAIDMALYTDRIYGSFNFNLGPGTERLRFTQTYVNDSGIEAGVALTYRLRPRGRTFVGLNARYLAAYTGAFFNQWTGHAVMVGPTFFHEFGDIGRLRGVFMSAAWTPQVWGRAAGGVTGTLDLVNFERQQFRLRIGGTL
ncbi:hypothetical protein E8L99_12280 [Phreatobacter aquaticus]|uniref:Uncharacterized protein n=1 Tax=Phreatobacter aquaticus TaxID=2570229 RepID=A0A4D7QM32_9HYPH|nr:hypothetical protein [Phreatobacter aquaticus]QCK86476.1 hypothetical protein E8L99_12280 [Phreatobacter aquaticus]